MIQHLSPFCLCLFVTSSLAVRADDVNFDRDIKPIFTAHCVQCHGEDKREGGLRLDHRGSALAGGDSGAVLKAGDSDASELFRRIATDDIDQKMPPPSDDNKPLTADQFATIANWC